LIATEDTEDTEDTEEIMVLGLSGKNEEKIRAGGGYEKK